MDWLFSDPPCCLFETAVAVIELKCGLGLAAVGVHALRRNALRSSRIMQDEASPNCTRFGLASGPCTMFVLIMHLNTFVPREADQLFTHPLLKPKSQGPTKSYEP